MKTSLLIILVLVQAAWAQADLVSDLQQMEIPASQIGAGAPVADDGIAPAIDSDGLPNQAAQPEIDDILDSAYSTSTLIEQALDESKSLPMGQRILHFQNAAKNIIKKSGQIPEEETVRITLNRAVDVMGTVLGISGYNPDLIAQWATNFYKTSFELALSFANNPCRLVSTQHTQSVSQYLAQTSIAQFGFVYSSLLWRNQSNLTSSALKAVVLIKMIGFLGWDFNMDLRRRETGLKETIADVYKIQKTDPAYRKIMQSLAQGQEPNSSDVAALRVKVFKLWSALPARLKSAGLKVP